MIDKPRADRKGKNRSSQCSVYMISTISSHTVYVAMEEKFEEQLILCVHDYSVLHDGKNKCHHDTEQKNNIWKEIADDLNYTGEQRYSHLLHSKVQSMHKIC